MRLLILLCVAALIASWLFFVLALAALAGVDWLAEGLGL